MRLARVVRFVAPAILAFFVLRPTLAQTSINIVEMGSVALPPVPPESPPGLVSDLWVTNGFAYVGRYVSTPERVEVFSVADPAAPFGPICSTTETPGSEVEDLIVEGRFLYVASQDNNADIDGVKVHDLLNQAAPSCTGPSFYLPNVASAHDLFAYSHSNGNRLLFVAQVRPDTMRGVHIFNVNDPGAPIFVATIPFPTPPTSYCTPAPGVPCAPHDIYVQQVGLQDLLVIAGLGDGSYIIDITTPVATAPIVAHFNYFWQAPDVDGDGVADCCDQFGDGLCDDTNFDMVVDDLDKVFLSNTHDARISPDGQYLWTTDERNCGGHIITWSLAELLAECGDADGCPAAAGEVLPAGEFWLNTPMPYTVHQVRWYSSNYAFVPWYEEGLRILGVKDDVAPQAPDLGAGANPIEVGFFDSLIPNTDGCIENGFPGEDNCKGNPAMGIPSHRVLNPGFGGDWGVSWDDCYLYIADRGSADNNEAPPEDAGSEGALIVLRYTGGPTTPQPLRITKNLLVPGELSASWGEVPFATAFNIYRGTIPMAGGMGTRPAGTEYDHTRIDLAACNVVGSSHMLATQFTPLGATCNNALDDDGDTFIDCADTVGGTENCALDQSCLPFAYYYIVTARSPCDDAADREGNYGQDSFGVNRPVAITTCPL